MTDLIQSLVAREPRYHVHEDHPITVVMERTQGEKVVSAEIVDISRTGVKLKTNQKVSAKEEIALKIHAKGLSQALSVNGSVCWVKPAQADLWLLGCTFKPPMPEKVMRELVQGGHFERREHEREQTTLRTVARWELASDDSPVWILNVSSGGFCLLSQEKGTPGSRVMLVLDREGDSQVLVTGKAQWQVESHEGFVIGCEFVSKEGYRVLREIQESCDPDAKGGEDADKSDKSSSLWQRVLKPW